MTPAAPLIAIVGPTASGKSALGIALAQRFGGEVVCCDSTQVYRHFDIGTAKVPAAEQHGVPHHMMDVLEPDEVFTAGEYRKRGEQVLADIRLRGKLPVLTVGTGLYLRALLEGLADAPTRSEELRARLNTRARKLGSTYLHRVLQRLDRAAAARIAPQDQPKIIRAIEVCMLAQKPISDVHSAGHAPLKGFHPVKIGLMPARTSLYARIEQRTQAMLAQGWLDEVRRLMTQGISANAKPFQFIGYRELQAHLAGALPLDRAAPQIAQATRRYAKRQITWFRKEPKVRWFTGFGDEQAISEAALHYVEQALAAARAPATGSV